MTQASEKKWHMIQITLPTVNLSSKFKLYSTNISLPLGNLTAFNTTQQHWLVLSLIWKKSSDSTWPAALFGPSMPFLSPCLYCAGSSSHESCHESLIIQMSQYFPLNSVLSPKRPGRLPIQIRLLSSFLKHSTSTQKLLSSALILRSPSWCYQRSAANWLLPSLLTLGIPNVW